MAIVRLISCSLLLAAFGYAAASAQDRHCGQTVVRAIASLRQNCAGLARNSLCYGHPTVDIAFAEDAAVEAFNRPADRAPLVNLARIQSSGLEQERQHFGIALLNLSANLPQTYQGPGIIIMLAGDAAVENEINPAEAPALSAPLSTAALVDTTLFRHPGVIPERVASVAADEILLVDAFDDSGKWLRVVNDGTIAWVAGADVARLNAMATLPAIGAGATFPFQALSVSTDTEFPECDQAESMVAIQTPQDMPISLTVNGVDIRVGAMVTLQQVHRNALSLTVHRGDVTTIFGGTVKQGESILGILGETPERDYEVLDWSGALTASEAELARGQRAQDALNLVARVNGWPTFQTFRHPPDLLHVVARGESLYSIGRLYETSVAEIILANLGDEPLRLYSGTTLIIPNPGSGFAGHGKVPLDATREE
ncbi:MAG: LysM domain-containing protein [Chloroflexi bacterium]|nr:LysM domain-containing protein [Chloroflexota bacterium]